MSGVVNFHGAHIDVFQQKCKLTKKQKILCINHQAYSVPYLLGLYAIEKFFTTLKDFIHQDLVYLIPDRKATIATTFFGSKVQKTAGSLSEKKEFSQTTN